MPVDAELVRLGGLFHDIGGFLLFGVALIAMLRWRPAGLISAYELQFEGRRDRPTQMSFATRGEAVSQPPDLAPGEPAVKSSS